MGLDAANLDRSVSPKNDFYQFANGTWCKQNPIPPEYSRWGSFETLAEENMKVLRAILDDAAASPEPSGSIKQKVGDFWRAAMDTAAIERAGASPLSDLLALVESAVSGYTPIAEVVAQFHVASVRVFFTFGDGPDAKNSTWSIAQVRQGGLGLPDRDYYFAEDKADIRTKYVAHVALMLELAGASPADARASAESVLELETRIASAHLTRVERRDPDLTYNKVTSLEELAKLCPDFDWPAYFAAAGKPKPGDVNMDCPKAVAAAVGAIKGTDKAQLSSYLRWHAVNSLAEYLSEAFVKADFDFFLGVLSGQKEQKPRWKRCLAKVNAYLPEALGQMYVERVFPADAKERAAAIVGKVRTALEERLKSVDWLEGPTREKALEKMGAFRVKIGFPDEWIDYGPLTIGKDDPWTKMILAVNRFEHARSMARIDAEVDRKRWLMPPQMVNAYYHPMLNEIVFPAAILQPPFFDKDADDALNFGAMGAVVGHEMTHGYDDQGRKYDSKGNLTNWWTDADGEEFNRRAAVMVAQANAFVVHSAAAAAECKGAADGPLKLKGGFGSVCACKTVNGSLTNGEDLADLGGLKLAYAAFKAGAPAEEPDKDGFTPSQRFFLGWAQVWRANITPEEASKRLTTDPHAPHTMRVNAPLRNMEEFHTAFGCGPGDAMWLPPAERVNIW